MVVWLGPEENDRVVLYLLYDVCSVSFDAVQIAADPSVLNKHMALGTGRLLLLPLNSGISLSLAGVDFGFVGNGRGTTSLAC